MPHKDPEAKRAAWQKWYRANQKKHHARVRDHERRRRKAMRLWFDGFKKKLKCARCPERRPPALDFHHRDPTQKEGSIGSIIHAGWAKERILAEIKKCIVLCANCHRVLHARRGKTLVT